MIKEEKAFSLVEVLVTIVILTVAVFPVINYFTGSIGIVNQSGTMSQAVDIAKDVMELLKNDNIVESIVLGDELQIDMSSSYSKGTLGTLEDTKYRVYQQASGYDLFTNYNIYILIFEEPSGNFNRLRNISIRISWSDSEFILDSTVRIG